MPYYVKTKGSAIAKRGPYETEEEASRVRESLALDPLYQGQHIFVEFESGVPLAPARSNFLKPSRPKSRPHRGRSGTRGSKRSSGGGSFGTGTAKRRRKRGYKRNSKRR